jgi:hypothetical protein
MKILTMIPMQRELDSFVQACCEAGYDTEAIATGRLSLTYFPALAIAVAPGGLGKTQFAVHTQHLLEQGQWELVICTGAAGALVDSISVGDVVIATENCAATPSRPSKPSASTMVRLLAGMKMLWRENDGQRFMRAREQS